MATRLRRKPPGKAKKCDNLEALSVQDLTCTACLQLFTEPVTLPCDHSFCLRCFRATVESAALSCPLCRTRIGSWLRRSSKAGSLVDLQLWGHVRRRGGELREQAEREAESAGLSARGLCAPGELRAEYLQQLQEARRERQLEEDKHKEQTETLIRELQQQQPAAVGVYRGARPAGAPGYRLGPMDAYLSRQPPCPSPTHRQEPSPELVSVSTVARCGRFLKNFLNNKLWGAVPPPHTHTQEGPPRAVAPPDVDTASEDSLNMELCYFKPLHPVPTQRAEKKRCPVKVHPLIVSAAITLTPHPPRDTLTDNVSVNSWGRLRGLASSRASSPSSTSSPSSGSLSTDSSSSAFVCLLRHTTQMPGEMSSTSSSSPLEEPAVRGAAGRSKRSGEHLQPPNTKKHKPCKESSPRCKPEVLEEQRRIEEMLLQEKKDFEFAKRLQRRLGGGVTSCQPPRRAALRRQVTLPRLLQAHTG